MTKEELIQNTLKLLAIELSPSHEMNQKAKQILLMYLGTLQKIYSFDVFGTTERLKPKRKSKKHNETPKA